MYQIDDIKNTILCGDALLELQKIPSASIDAVVTSPPYWNLRDYGVDGQIGLESTFQEYINKLCNIFDEIKRVLKKEGTCWVNLGDTYSGNKEGKTGKKVSDYLKEQTINLHKKIGSIVEKSLCQIPARFAIEMMNRGWILRNEIIWHKPNCMPSSASDRFTVDFEKVFFFVKNKKYLFDSDSVREPHGEDQRASGLERARKLGYDGKGSYQDWYNNQRKKKSFSQHNGMDIISGLRNDNDIPVLPHPLGRSKRTVWSITTKPFKEAHFATFPEQLVTIPIKAGCPKNGIVLDCFMGAGTTALVALKLNRNYVGIELNSDYIKIAEDRLKPYKNTLFNNSVDKKA